MRPIEILMIISTVLALVIAMYINHCHISNRASDPQEMEIHETGQ